MPMNPADYYRGTPSTDSDRYFWCEYCAMGFSGPPIDLTTDTPKCIRCKATGDGVWMSILPQEGGETDMARQAGQTATGAAKPAAQGSKTPRAPKKPKEQHPCACGCGRQTGGTWAPGHDAKFYAAVKKVNAKEDGAEEALSKFPDATIKEFAGNVH